MGIEPHGTPPSSPTNALKPRNSSDEARPAYGCPEVSQLLWLPALSVHLPRERMGGGSGKSRGFELGAATSPATVVGRLWNITNGEKQLGVGKRLPYVFLSAPSIYPHPICLFPSQFSFSPPPIAHPSSTQEPVMGSLSSVSPRIFFPSPSFPPLATGYPFCLWLMAPLASSSSPSTCIVEGRGWGREGQSRSSVLFP